MPVTAAVLFEFTLRELRQRAAGRADRQMAALRWLYPAERLRVQRLLAADERISAQQATRRVRTEHGGRDLAGGRIAATIYPLGTALPQVQSGRIRALATTGRTRVPALPDVPTVNEAGFPMIEGSEWFGVFAPAKTSPEVVARLNVAIGRAARTNEFQSGLAKLSVDSAFAPPGEFAQRLKTEYERWAPIVRASGFKPED